MPIEYNPAGLPACCGGLLDPKRPLQCPDCGTVYNTDEVIAEMRRIQAERKAARKTKQP